MEKDISTITKIFGKPNLIIKQNKTKNYQYHYQSCFIDIFLISIKSDYIVKHIETRSSELNKSFDKKVCYIEISNLIKK